MRNFSDPAIKFWYSNYWELHFLYKGFGKILSSGLHFCALLNIIWSNDHFGSRQTSWKSHPKAAQGLRVFESRKTPVEHLRNFVESFEINAHANVYTKHKLLQNRTCDSIFHLNIFENTAEIVKVFFSDSPNRNFDGIHKILFWVCLQFQKGGINLKANKRIPWQHRVLKKLRKKIIMVHHLY